MVNVLERPTPKASGNGNGLPPFLLTAAGGNNGDDPDKRGDFIVILTEGRDFYGTRNGNYR